MVTFISLTGIAALVWLACFAAFNDLFLPARNQRKYRRILYVFAHMDDETVLAGGMLSTRPHSATLMILTRGEKGNDSRKADPGLPAIRKRELANVMAILGVEKLIHKDYEDETLTAKKALLKKDVEDAIRTAQPDLVVTFDKNGWYGHEDHIACCEVVTEAVKKHKNIDLWYAVRPEAVNRAARFVNRLRGGAALTPRTPPTHKVFTGSNTIKKIRAVYQYRSQMNALRPGITVGPIPMWFFMSAQPYEYIVEA